MTKEIKLIAENKVFDGWHKRYQHISEVNHCEMTFAIYLPPNASEDNPVPVVYWLSGLTCTDENFMQKAGAQRYATELGVAIVAPDTSPRGEGVPDDPEGHWDFGLGAGFYVDATQPPWSENYNMYSYVTRELPELVESTFPVTGKKSIMGHSMGGHGALISALKNQAGYASISAFAPIANPVNCPWGKKAFTHYLGSQESTWREYDACELISSGAAELPILIDQGGADNFLDEQLSFDRLQEVVAEKNWQARLNLRAGYDHSYFFIASFIEEHLRFHVSYLK
ncbi:S-formylglutathione hydrolase [Teredinibacter sp. KSP-S5-2]|uniref:S-formylglutathione hydrolase n=1 Tax=Teredinibacter sp. KSP-S5-2 TaxID=3034506 RepID=UPI002934E9D5|nr:S-formylglutathione hydrolase [Teredinibacter sp. KSP-S5-2]WNO08908.1 S-formylglutathione hydrolase [Teredinibacter sp. KSP-S5-2]